ncbi:MAG: M3 family metallopeptidase [Bacteroidales bacterium]|jgi:peptidyl-dipeptidase Dcp|nr:M3 family metallopeptidase [Bacteroidales bacterium]
MLMITGVFGILLSSCKNQEVIDKSNPFFSEYNTPFDVPPFEKIQAKHYMPAFEIGMDEGRKDIEAIVENKETPNFENTITALDKSGKLLTRVTSVFFAQTSANTNDSLQNIEVEISPKLSSYSDEIYLNPGLFQKIKHVYENQESENLTPEQKFLLENLYKEFVRFGANLNKTDQDTLRSLNQRLSVLTVKFSQNVLEETNDYNLFVGKEDLAGLPESLVGAAAETATAAGREGEWAFTTQRPSIFPFLQYSENRDLRRELFNAYTNRGNNGNEYDNNKILAEIVKLRAERAKLLGYKTHSHLVLEPRMAEVPENVFDLLNNLWDKAIPVAKNEVKEMQQIINREGGNFKLEPSDWWYYAEKLRKQKYDLDDNELRPYFKLENVREGVFTSANRLYGITFEPVAGLPLPHPEAEAYEVKEADGSHIGILYLDFHPRDSKRQGAWCGGYRDHHIEDGKTIPPVVTVVCNFTRPSGELPALLSMEEVETLFHEFGHALEGLFSKKTYNMSYIAWDFVELPSQIMEHWATQPELMRDYARHYQTGEPIPQALIDKIGNSKYFNQGFSNVEILAASLLDMAFYTLEAPAVIDVQSFEKDYLSKIGLIPEIVSRYRSTYFLHIIDGYDSGYYSYTWAAVLDNDAFEAFKENGIFDRTTAESFRRNILEKDGTMDAMQMYVNFRGREPEIEPLLVNRGLIAN